MRRLQATFALFWCLAAGVHAQELDRPLRAVHLSGNWGLTADAVSLWEMDRTQPLVPQPYIEYLRSVHVDWVGFSVALHVEHSMDSTLERTYSDVRVPTFSDDAVRQIVREFRAHGFSVYMTLAIESFETEEELDAVEHPAPRWQLGDPVGPDTEFWPWRPSHPAHERFVAEFWESYAAQATHFAKIAEEEDRFSKTPLHVFVGEGDGSFSHAPELVEGTIAVRSPIVVADDFNGNGRADLAVFDEGVYVFAVRNGDGTFTSEPDRVSYEALRNPPDFRQWVGNDIVDLDNDGDLELVLGPQSPPKFGLGVPGTVLVNDGAGHYPTRIDLPRPPFNDGYTRVSWLTHFDVNADGFQDLLLTHRRLYEGPTNEIPDTGRYIQVLINRGGTSFSDETPAWMGDQSATTPERDAEGNELNNDAAPRMHDIDGDGCADLVMSQGPGVRTEAPLAYRNDGDGRFQAMSPVPFVGSDRYFGHGAVPADVNGDGAIDLVVPLRDHGPDGLWGTADDFTTLVTLLNTTPARSARCRPRVTTVGTLPARTLYVGAGAVAVVVPAAGAFRHGSTYGASSSAPGVATAGVLGSQATVTPVTAGVATITVTATGADNSVATQRFRVTVLAATTFSDHLISGTTPPRALHFLELRTRIATLRTREGLSPVRWTDPVLTVGVTPVKQVHLTELRTALDAAYQAAGRLRPTYTDSIVTAGMTAIKAVHVVELRDAILALE